MNTSVRARAAMAAAVVAVAAMTAGASHHEATAVAPTEKERVCTNTQTFDNMGSGKKVNISLCAETDGLNVTVTGSADCFYAFGSKKLDNCTVTGDWMLREVLTDPRKEYKYTSTTDLGGSARYPGPGKYTLFATVSARGEQGGSGGTSSVVAGNGNMERTIVLKTPAGSRRA